MNNKQINNTLKISVIIPVYNTEKYITKCLTSIVNQSFTNIEIIIINDCSTDNTINICKEFATTDNRIKIINHTINQGVGIARNTGLDHASGEYIAFVDPDDWLETEYFEKLYNTAISTKADLTVSQVLHVSKKRVSFGWASLHHSIVNQLELITPQHKQYTIYSGVVWNKLYKASFIKQNNIKFLNKRILYEDQYFTFLVGTLCNKIAVNNSAMYYYFKQPNSLTQIGKKHKSTLDMFEILNEYRIWLTNTNLISLELKKYYFYILEIKHITIYNLCFNLNIADKLSFYNHMLIGLQNITLSNNEFVNDNNLTYITKIYNLFTKPIYNYKYNIGIFNIFTYNRTPLEKSITLFKYIKLLTVYSNLKRYKYYILGLLILKNKFNNGKFIIYLLGIIPIYYRKTNTI